MAEGWSLFLALVTALAILTQISFVDGDNKTLVRVFAVLSTGEEISRDDSGTLHLPAADTHKFIIVGMNIGNETEIYFTPTNMTKGSDCSNTKRLKVFRPSSASDDMTKAFYDIHLDEFDPGEEFYYVCVKSNNNEAKWLHQGIDPLVRISIKSKPSPLLPMWLQIIIILGLFCLSGLFSGLNLGLMALDKTELQIIEKCGSPSEKKYAKVITPLRKRGNFLLCTLLLGNVMVNSGSTILIDDMFDGIVAMITSTLCIVLFGEIIPQAICSRHGLAVGAKTSWITRFFMIITFPVSFPISLVLDKILGEEMGQVYNKEKLQELIRMTADIKVLQNDEANIIAGALQLANKRVEDVMTKMEDVYMLDINTVLDFETMSEILNYGYTRVPVYDGDKANIVHLLNTKELALIDPDDNTPLKTVCRFYDHRPMFVDYDFKLDAMLQDFLHGNSHMAIVQRLHTDDDHDPYYDNIGVVTLEDVIEEIIQSEIVDETDILSDNRKKKPRRREIRDHNVFEQKQENILRISQQLTFAAFQYLSTAVEPFKDQYINRSVLKQMIGQNIVSTINPTFPASAKNYIYIAGKECDYFVLLLEGHVEVEVGKETMVFESGPFSYFGTECLDGLKDLRLEVAKDFNWRKMPPYVPDYSVRAITPVHFLRIRRMHYLAAKRTSLMVSSSFAETGHEEAFHLEWHRTVANSGNISRNNSSAGVTDLSAEPSLSPLERVQRRALRLENSHYASNSGLCPLAGSLTSIRKADLETHSAVVSKVEENRDHLEQEVPSSNSISVNNSIMMNNNTMGVKEQEKDNLTELLVTQVDKDGNSLLPSEALLLIPLEVVPHVEVRTRTFNVHSDSLTGAVDQNVTKSPSEDSYLLASDTSDVKAPLMKLRDNRSGGDSAQVGDEEEKVPLVGTGNKL